ncbi:hypothetical protein, partial [Nocardia abscessus]|uniref:hypothetical protein n=1 Tax=Nocardia abscessus TaxID=120957 RepID=UPI002456BE6B
ARRRPRPAPGSRPPRRGRAAPPARRAPPPPPPPPPPPRGPSAGVLERPGRAAVVAAFLVGWRPIASTRSEASSNEQVHRDQ